MASIRHFAPVSVITRLLLRLLHVDHLHLGHPIAQEGSRLPLHPPRLGDDFFHLGEVGGFQEELVRQFTTALILDKGTNEVLEVVVVKENVVRTVVSTAW